MYTWERPREIWRTPQGGLEFSIKYHLHREKGRGGVGLRGESEWLLGKMNERLEEQVEVW